MLSKGGDTDTNAAIVGGLIGAAVGLTKIPRDMVQQLLDFDSDPLNEDCSRAMRRERYLIPKHNLNRMMNQIYSRAPKELSV